MFQIIRHDTNYAFTKLMKPALILSGALILLSIATVVVEGGLNYGIDFGGGTIVEIKFNAPVDIAAVRDALGPAGLGGAEINDLQSRETLETRLGVFANFDPKLPDGYRDAAFIFLGNIDPELQLGVLSQMRAPRLVVCDTMNYWIQGKRAELMELLRRVDILLVNDTEARELSGDWNIRGRRAGFWPGARAAWSSSRVNTAPC